FSISDLYDMKRAHETERPGDRSWCTAHEAEQFVAKLVAAHSLVLLTGRKPIRSGTPMPDSVLPERDARPVPDERDGSFVRGPIRIRDLAGELGMTQRSLLELCGLLGVPARSKDTKLSEPYADMVRRRARRDQLARPTPGAAL
ncbi:MAG: hypothetical protein ABMA25_06950, partial [Ilumatobacteraceae bacterium]